MQRTNSQSSSGSLQPCSGSILLNPLPPSPSASTSTSLIPRSPPAVSGSLAGASNARPRRPSVAICVSATAEPPAWYHAEQSPGTPYGSPPKGNSKSRSNSVDRWAINSDSEDDCPAGGSRARLPCGKETSIQFAPLPPGRPRSNSITIGVASRAHMLNAQNGGGPGQQQQQQQNYSRQARYAGPQWYQSGGVVPPDVYTYKDLARGLSNVWRKAKKARRPSTASTTSSSASAEQALDMERDAKSKGGIEHIEEAEEEHDLDQDGEEEDSDSDGEGEAGRGRALGMSMGPFRAGSVESSSSGERSEGSGGSGALSTSATSTGTASGEVGDEKWEAAAAAVRRASKGKGKAAVQGA